MSDDIKKFGGESADVFWDERLCIHVGECGRAANALFEGGRTPWCQPDLVGIGEVVDVVERCPTGALTYIRKDGGEAEEPSPANAIVVSADGPLYVRGELQIDGTTDDMPGVHFRAALCRCGQSQNKPFCDNSHVDANFRDSGAVGEKGDGVEAPGGPLQVNKAANGPLLLKGNFTLYASSGRVAFEGTKAALCRCGASKNKPFCDGSHKPAGFKAD